MKWGTCERPKVDRIACPWLILRFVDNDAQFIFVPIDQVAAVAQREPATPFDVPGVELAHEGPLCNFDAILKKYRLNEPALDELATIVRGADTSRPDLAPQCPGLLAISLGLSHVFKDDHEQLRHSLVLYDALYACCKHVRGKTHNWNLQRKALTGQKHDTTIGQDEFSGQVVSDWLRYSAWKLA